MNQEGSHHGECSGASAHAPVTSLTAALDEYFGAEELEQLGQLTSDTMPRQLTSDTMPRQLTSDPIPRQLTGDTIPRHLTGDTMTRQMFPPPISIKQEPICHDSLSFNSSCTTEIAPSGLSAMYSTPRIPQHSEPQSPPPVASSSSSVGDKMKKPSGVVKGRFITNFQNIVNDSRQKKIICVFTVTC